ncbi:acyltransferase family protein [Sphingobacterium spiritivorum]|uniref:acyltransferase family protein n=1 Tax=Sphingobacterium spiritivorum TaxID=258 RepID=UPI003DA2DD7B
MKLSYINSARGMAILMVILVHVFTLYSGKVNHPLIKILFYYGQMGVQLFFVASAYTLCLSSENRQSENKSLIKFYIRRYFRIFPIFYLGIVIYYFLNYILKEVDQYTVGNITANIFLIHGLIPSAINLVPGGWSIGTEILFYLLFPFLNRFLFSGYLILKMSVLIVSCYVIAFSMDSNIINNTFWYFNIIVQLPVFIIGMLYYKKQHVLKQSYALVLFVAFTLLTLYLWQNHLIAFIPLSAAVSFCGLLKILEKSIVNNVVFQRIGVASYSIYIIHWILPFYVLSKTHSVIILFVYYILTVVVSFVFALILENVIEKPFIKKGQKLILSIK